MVVGNTQVRTVNGGGEYSREEEMVASAAIPGHANTSTPVEYLE